MSCRKTQHRKHQCSSAHGYGEEDDAVVRKKHSLHRKPPLFCPAGFARQEIGDLGRLLKRCLLRTEVTWQRRGRSQITFGECVGAELVNDRRRGHGDCGRYSRHVRAESAFRI